MGLLSWVELYLLASLLYLGLEIGLLIGSSAGICNAISVEQAHLNHRLKRGDHFTILYAMQVQTCRNESDLCLVVL